VGGVFLGGGVVGRGGGMGLFWCGGGGGGGGGVGCGWVCMRGKKVRLKPIRDTHTQNW